MPLFESGGLQMYEYDLFPKIPDLGSDLCTPFLATVIIMTHSSGLVYGADIARHVFI